MKARYAGDTFSPPQFVGLPLTPPQSAGGFPAHCRLRSSHAGSRTLNKWITIAAQNPEIFYIQSVQALNAPFARGHEMHIIVNRPTTHSQFPCVELGRNHIFHAHLYKPHAWQNAFSDHFCCNRSVNPNSQSAARQSGEGFT